jgi:membrane-bound lytic murein transglycosylase D
MRLLSLNFAFLLGCLLGGKVSYVQPITVPNKLKFANMQLYITPEAKEEIQKKITSLTRSAKHYQEIFDRVNLYMPIIEKILQEEKMPEDLKYLVIQESALISDHVSTSNAVGFWQFKKEAASELGVRMDRYIDERMHVVESTRAFVKYMKKNQAQFNNWLYALLAYYLGRGGAKAYIEEKKWHIQHTKAIVDGRAHWYIYHFLAHKLVFQDAVGKELHPELRLYECRDCQGKTLHELSQQFGVPVHMMQYYNKWLKPLKVPEDAACSMLIPLTHQQYAQIERLGLSNSPLNKHRIDYSAYWEHGTRFPIISPSPGSVERSTLLINGVRGVAAEPGDTLALLAQKGGISLQQFLNYNDITTNHQVQPGQVYYWKPKRSKAAVHYHIVRPQETWWSISQKYGVKQASLLKKNRIRQVGPLRLGQVVWLRFIRPSNIPIAYVKDPALNNNSTLTAEGMSAPKESKALPVPKDITVEP